MHTPMFHQLRGSVMNRGVAITHLRGIPNIGPSSAPTSESVCAVPLPFHRAVVRDRYLLHGVCGGTGLGADGATARCTQALAGCEWAAPAWCTLTCCAPAGGPVRS